MRIWDIHPGYLNRQSLLGEHRELHGIVSIITHKKRGYANHPETLRWVGYGWALRQRHRIIASEMELRGYTDRTPVATRSNKGVWPAQFIDSPGRQFEILSSKYISKEQGRIPLPKTAVDLWSHHKYSVLARDQTLYKKLESTVPEMSYPEGFASLAETLTALLRHPPTVRGIQKVLSSIQEGKTRSTSQKSVLEELQSEALLHQDSPLYPTTALSELRAWVRI